MTHSAIAFWQFTVAWPTRSVADVVPRETFKPSERPFDLQLGEPYAMNVQFEHFQSKELRPYIAGLNKPAIATLIERRPRL